jgi:hypothetical protein
MNENTVVPQTLPEVHIQEQKSPTFYIFVRRLFFVLSILFFLGVLVFLVYYNGKSIYVNGL